MGSNTFRILGVPDILRKDIDCFILNEFNGTEGTAIHVLPSAIPQIVFHHKAGKPAIENIVTQSRRVSVLPTLFLCGPGTEPSVMSFGAGSYSVLQVILKPHALKSLLGLNALTLREGVVDLNDISPEDMNERLMNARGTRDQVTLLTSFLVDRLRESEARDELIEQGLRLIHQSAGAISVRMLSKTLNISERQFERRFSQTVGISPFAYIRIRRLNEALRLMKDGRYDTLTEVAHALNFHDQSHFIRDIKKFTGITPKGLSQKVDDFVHNQAGYSYL